MQLNSTKIELSNSSSNIFVDLPEGDLGLELVILVQVSIILVKLTQTNSNSNIFVNLKLLTRVQLLLT